MVDLGKIEHSHLPIRSKIGTLNLHLAQIGKGRKDDTLLLFPRLHNIVYQILKCSDFL